MRNALAAVLACVLPLPAVAQTHYCRTERFEDGNQSIVNAYIGDGPGLTGLLTSNGPIFNAIAIDAASGFELRVDRKSPAMLYIYRTGHSLPGKDWRQPGSIFSEVSGVGVSWPRFWAGDDQEYDIRFRLGALSWQQRALFPLNATDYVGMILPFTADNSIAYPQDWYTPTSDFDPAPWHEAVDRAVRQGIPLEVEFIHNHGPKQGQPFALTRFRLPSGAELQARFVSDMSHFRRIATAGECIKP